MRTILAAALTFVLSGCSQLEPTLVWLSPSAGSNVSGLVELTVFTPSTPPANVVFSHGDTVIGKAYRDTASGSQDEDRFTAVWDTSDTPPGSYTLTAIPYGGAPVSTQVTVVSRSGNPTNPPPPAADNPLGRDPLRLRGLLDLWDASSSAVTAVIGFPPDFPWQALLGREAVAARLRAFNQQDATVLLPRGRYAFDSEQEGWRYEPEDDPDTLHVSYRLPDPDTGRERVVDLIVHWAEHTPTTVVATLEGSREVPTGARMIASDDGEVVIDLDLDANWHAPEGCSAILEPATLTVTGQLGRERVTEEDEPLPRIERADSEVYVDLNLDHDGDNLDFALALELLLTHDTLVADTTLTATGLAETGREDCFLEAVAVTELDAFAELATSAVDGPWQGSSLAVVATDPVYEGLFPEQVTLEGGLTSFDEHSGIEDVTSFTGVLDGFAGGAGTVPGEQVVVTLPDGSETTLASYFAWLAEAYQDALEFEFDQPRHDHRQ